MPLEEDLLETANRLLSPRRVRGRPKQADLRRAISTAYYAVFHALCRMCADSLTGKGKKSRNAWRQVYRAVEHGCTKNRCQNNIINKKFPLEVRTFCAIFIQLQEKRHEADYDPFAQLKVKDVKQAILMAALAIQMVSNRQLELTDRRAFAIWLLMRKR